MNDSNWCQSLTWESRDLNFVLSKKKPRLPNRLIKINGSDCSTIELRYSDQISLQSKSIFVKLNWTVQEKQSLDQNYIQATNAKFKHCIVLFPSRAEASYQNLKIAEATMLTTLGLLLLLRYNTTRHHNLQCQGQQIKSKKEDAVESSTGRWVKAEEVVVLS